MTLNQNEKYYDHTWKLTFQKVKLKTILYHLKTIIIIIIIFLNQLILIMNINLIHNLILILYHYFQLVWHKKNDLEILVTFAV